MFSEWRKTWLRIKAIWKRPQLDRDLDDEVAFHLEMREKTSRLAGIDPQEARFAARRQFGNISMLKETSREMWTFATVETLWQDLRFGARTLRKNSGFSAVAIVTLALGITANVTVFSFVDALFLRTVPAKNPERLVRIVASENDGEGLFSIPEFTYLRDHSKTLEELTAHYSSAPLYISANGETGEVQAAVVSSSYFAMLGLQPYFGRFFTHEEDMVPDRDAVAVLGYGLWQRSYRGDSGILGKTFLINGHSFAIIGVMPQDFHGVEIGGMPNEIWIPSMMIRVGYRWCDGFQPNCTILQLMGRIRPDANPSEARVEIATLMEQLRTSASGFDERLGVSVTPAIGISGGREYFLLLTRLLTTIGGLLLLIVCANLGGLLVARGAAREAEIAMRRALGAGRGRIVRQLLTESLLLACTGGALGLLISLWTSRLLVGFYAVDDEGYRHLFDVRPDPTVVLYSVAVTVMAGALFGLLPALQGSSSDLNQVLKSGGSTLGVSRQRIRAVLAAVQFAFSLALLVGAGLLARSAARIETGTNMDVHHVLGLRLPLSLIRYPAAKAYTFKREVVRRLRELPGVESVSLAKGQGLVWHTGGKAGTRMTLPGKTYPKPEDEPMISSKQIAPDYFATLRIPFIAGRDFNDSDRHGSPPVAIVNETLASRIALDKLPLGQTMLIEDKPYQVVGVVKDAQARNTIEGPVPVAYLAFWQDETLLEARMCIRVTGDPATALPMIRKTIASIDSEVPVTETMPLIDQVRGAYTDARLAAAVLICAAIIAVVLSAIGLFGVIAYEVGQRTREIGIRLALGATPRQVVVLFLKKGLAVVLAGCIAGLFLSLAASRLLSAWLFNVRPSDPATFGAAALLLALVALLASYLPSRRATQVDPVQALRHE
jgi:macrolide transport system ATP-binding/permease protein